MNGQEIINLFNTYTDDNSELSSVEELALLNRIYREILGKKQWEFLKKSQTGVLSTSVPYVALASDFSNFVENAQYTDISYGQDNSVSKVVFVGDSYTPYKIINFSDRRQYRDVDGYAYLDYPNSRLVFTKQPTSALSYEYDYIYTPSDIALNTSPVFKSDFHPMIAFGMASDGFIIQLFDKAKSYSGENKTKFEQYLSDLSYWNANLRCE